MSYFRMVNSTLSSALSSFTSEFGMGSGGSYSLLSPGKSLLSVNLAPSRRRVASAADLLVFS